MTPTGNPVLADIFARFGYMERQGSGLSKIRMGYENAANYTPDCAPRFYSDSVQFKVILPNLNFKTSQSGVLNEVLDEVLNAEEELLLDFFRNNTSATQKEAIEFLPLSKRKIQAMMKNLMDRGYMERIGSKRNGAWIVKRR